MRMMMRALAVVGVLAVSSVAFAQADPNVGTWKLNLAKSKFTAGPTPKSQTVVIVAAGKGLKVSSESVLADGTTRKTSYTSAYDGKDTAVTGPPDYDSVAATRAGNTITGTRKLAGKVVQTYKTVLSADGKTRTTTVTGTTAKGEKVDSVAVYDKQ